MQPVWVIVVVAGLLVLAIWRLGFRKSGHFQAKEELAGKLALFSSDHVIGYDGKGALAMDKKSRKVLIMDAGGRRKVVTFADILGVALLENDRVAAMTEASGHRGLDEAVVRELLAKAPGGQDGAAAADTVQSVSLRLILADPGEPYWSVVFFEDAKNPARRGSGRHGKARGQADRWCALFQVSIRQADAEEASPRRKDWRESAVA